jgi:tetratricopeptide (TPR) repeat protein
VSFWSKIIFLEGLIFMPVSSYGFEWTGDDFNEEQKKIVFEKTTEIIERNKSIELLSRAFYDRGIIYSEQGDYEKAIKDYTSAIQLNFHHPDAVYYNRGIAYFEKRQYEAALNDFNKALSFDSEAKDIQEMVKQTSEIMKKI